MILNFSDVNPTLFDLDGKFLHGKLVFLAPGTTKTYKNVFDKDGNNLGHIIQTNQYGRLQTQIFLEGAYDVQYWQFVGTTFDLEDDTQFQLVRTERVLDPEANFSFKVEGATTFNTVTEMRDFVTGGLDDFTTCFRMGYYKGGDHEPLAYYWDSTATGTDDGGYVIKPSGVTGSGRWIAMLPERVNVKWFGVKTSSLQSTVTYQSSAMLAAKNIANRLGKELYFPGDYFNTYYGIDSVTIDVGNSDIRMDGRVRLVAKSGTTNSIKCYNLYCDRDDQVFLGDIGDNISVTAHEIWTASLHNWGAVKADIVHWNDSVQQSSFRNCTVYIETEPANNMAFDACRIVFASDEYKFECEGQLYRFSNMEFSDKMFQAGIINYGFVNVAQNCIADIDEYRDATNWVNLMLDWGKTDIDCANKFMTEIDTTYGVTLRNVYAGKVVHSGDTDLLIMRGVVNSLTFSHVNNGLLLVDVQLGTGDTTIAALKLVCNKVEIGNANASVNAATLEAVNSTFLCQIGTTTCQVRDCSFGAALAASNIVSTGCRYDGDIAVFHTKTFTIQFEDNVIGKSSYMRIAKHPDAVVTEGEPYNATSLDSSWINNTVLHTDFWIVMDRTHMDPDDSHHGYVYRGNVGGMQPEKGVTIDVPFVGVNGGDFGLSVVTGGTLDYTKSEDSSTGSVIMRGKCIQNFFLFSIGTENVTAKVTIEFLGTRPTSTVYPDRKIVGYARWASIPSRTVTIMSTEDSVAWPKPGATDSSQVEYHAPLEFLGGYMWGLFNTYHAAFMYSSPSSYTLLQRASGGKALMDDLGWIAGQSMPMPKMGLHVTAEVIK